jgi:hypothetical protein
VTRLARSNSFLGKVQRGLGSGYLEALDRPADVVESAVLRCLADDPRDNAQDESRDLYYARIVLACGVEHAPIAALLAKSRDPEGQFGSLPLDVLGLLARAGRQVAATSIRDYVAWGPRWGQAVTTLGEIGDPGGWKGLDGVLLTRFGPSFPEELDGQHWVSDEEPWRTWRRLGPLSPLLPPDRDLPPAPLDLESMSPAVLLGNVRGIGPLRPDRAAALLVARIRAGSTADRVVVEGALRGENIELAAQAIQVLGILGDSSIIPVAEELLPRLSGFANGKAPFRLSIARGLEGLESPAALDLARRWRGKTDYRQVIAYGLLERHATNDDLDWVVGRIRWAARTHWDLYSYAKILRRFPGRGPFEGFADIYRRYVPTCCRADLVDAMSITDPQFGTTLAFECLFDCEPLAREAAVRTVDLSIAGARERVELLRSDPLEDDGVKVAAEARLR